MKAFSTRHMGKTCLTFANGFSVSIVFDAATYSDNYDLNCRYTPDHLESDTAEVAIISPDGQLLKIGYDTVLPYQSIEDVLHILKIVSKDSFSPEVDLAHLE